MRLNPICDVVGSLPSIEEHIERMAQALMQVRQRQRVVRSDFQLAVFMRVRAEGEGYIGELEARSWLSGRKARARLSAAGMR